MRWFRARLLVGAAGSDGATRDAGEGGTPAIVRKDARIAGILRLLLAVFAPVRLIFTQNEILIAGNAQATAANIASHEATFRLGILTDVVAALLTLFVAFALFRLFRKMERDLASLMLVLGGLMVTPLYFFNLLNDAAALVVALAPSDLAGFDQQQREGLVSLFLRLHRYGVVVNEVFWGAAVSRSGRRNCGDVVADVWPPVASTFARALDVILHGMMPANSHARRLR